jgi:enoyl-CoA hydratase/carnithine racemase
MEFSGDCVNVETDGPVAWVTIDNPPANVITTALFGELAALAEELAADEELKVVIFKSANPDFFIAHFDVSAIIDMAAGSRQEAEEVLVVFHAMLRTIRNMDKATIGQIEGRVGGGGAEFSMSLDMRFGVRGKTRFNQMEVPLGILPGGSGTQMLPRLIGRGRAMEVILGADDLDAETAENWGLLNRTFEADEIEDRVNELARRIAAFPKPALALAKQSINCADKPLEQGLEDERRLFVDLLYTEDAPRQMQRFMDAGGQTPEVEKRIPEVSREICDG